jgi:hypothetical protein
LRARFHAKIGNPAAALEDLEDLLAVGNALAYDPDILGFFMSMSAYARACTLLPTVLEAHARAWNLSATDAEFCRQSMRRLMAGFADESIDDRSVVLSYYAERTYVIDEFNHPVGRIDSWSSFVKLMQQPALSLDLVRHMHVLAATATAVEAPTYPDAALMLPHEPEPNARFARWSRPVTYNGVRNISTRVVELRYKLLAYRRMARTILAIYLYAQDHGDWPSSLETLVPDYLPRVPADPFATDENPIRYVSSAPERLYSIGVNGVDDGGSSERFSSSEMKDVVLYLKGSAVPEGN